MPHRAKKAGPSQKILAAAYRCIALHGYANVSLRDIADEAGVVLSQLNYYYKNKEGLLSEVFRAMARNFRTEVGEGLKKGATVKEKISGLIGRFQEIQKSRPELFELLVDMTSVSMRSARFGGQLREMYKGLSGMIERELSPMFRGGGLTPAELAQATVKMLLGTAMQSVLEPDGADWDAPRKAMDLAVGRAELV